MPLFPRNPEERRTVAPGQAPRSSLRRQGPRGRPLAEMVVSVRGRSYVKTTAKRLWDKRSHPPRPRRLGPGPRPGAGKDGLAPDPGPSSPPSGVHPASLGPSRMRSWVGGRGHRCFWGSRRNQDEADPQAGSTRLNHTGRRHRPQFPSLDQALGPPAPPRPSAPGSACPPARGGACRRRWRRASLRGARARPAECPRLVAAASPRWHSVCSHCWPVF